MGYIDLRIGSTEELLRIGGHIGYRVDPPFRGHRYAARSVKLILPIAHGLGVDPVIITCNTDNEASRRTCELAGGRFVGTATVPPDSEMFARGDRVKCRFAFGAADSPRDVSKTEEARPN
jgi:tagatose 1,6-diphosphate aldolase